MGSAITGAGEIAEEWCEAVVSGTMYVDVFEANTFSGTEESVEGVLVGAVEGVGIIGVTWLPPLPRWRITIKADRIAHTTMNAKTNRFVTEKQARTCASSGDASNAPGILLCPRRD